MKKRFIALAAISLIIASGGCSNSVDSAVSGDKTSNIQSSEASQKRVSSEDYKEMVSECLKNMEEEGVLLSNMGKFEYKKWEALENIGGNVKHDEIVSNAKEWLIENAGIGGTELEDNYDNICKQYKEIAKIDASAPELVDIDEHFDSLFVTFNDLYSLITSPSGDLNSFADKFNKYIDDFKSHKSMLDILLEN